MRSTSRGGMCSAMVLPGSAGRFKSLVQRCLYGPKCPEHLKGKSTIDYAMDLMEHAEVVNRAGQGFRRKRRRLYADCPGGKRAAPAPGNSQYKPICPAKTDKKGKTRPAGRSADKHRTMIGQRSRKLSISILSC